MAKNSIRDYSATNSSNTDIQSIDISEGCSPAGINNAIREVMADLKDVSTGAVALESPAADSLTVTGAFTSQGIDDNATSTAMTLDASGNLLVGKTSSAFGTAGVESSASGGIWSTRSVFQPASFNLLSNDGPIAAFYKDSALVGTIGSRSGNLYIGSGDTTLKFEAGGDYIVPASTTGADRDNAIDLGNTATQFKNLYLSGGVYLGGTGSANHLDDYEEGTWTPASGTNVTLSSGVGSYIKIGNTVLFRGRFTVTNISGNMFIQGLPYIASSSFESACIAERSPVALNYRVVDNGSATIILNVVSTWSGSQTMYVAGQYQVA
jgi:hypothetical protein